MHELTKQLAARQLIQELIAQQAPLDDVLSAICQLVEKLLPGALGSIMLYDAEGETLSMVAGSHLSPAYQRSMQNIPIGPEFGVCGAAAFHREPVIVADMDQDTRWESFRHKTRAEGLRACWSLPVIAPSGELLGTFAIYYRVPTAPSNFEQDQIRRTAALVAIAIGQHRDRQTLAAAEQRYRSLFTQHPDAVYELDLDGFLRSSNPSLSRITGFSEDDVLGQHWSGFVAEDDLPRTRAHFARACQGEPQAYEITAINAAGQPYMLGVTNLPIVVDNQVIGVYGIARDITQHKENEARLAHHAIYDALTQLPNRQQFDACLQREHRLCCQQGSRLSVLYIDLDGFKQINDDLGRGIGDQLLVATARRLKALLAPGDMVARLANDEFVMLLPGLAPREAVITRAEQVLEALAQPFAMQELLLHVSASIGIASSLGAAYHLDEFVRYAEWAKQEAKHQGRNTWQWYNRKLMPDAIEQVTLRRQLQEAIREQQLELHYQPIIDAASGRLCSVEALVRWRHPEQGLISPGVFIPLAEKTGQIIAIGRWVLQRACWDMVKLAAESEHALRVAVNISPLQFRRDGFVEEVKRVLAATELPSRCLEIEVTEGVLMANTEKAIDTLHALQAMGVQVAIDDFGTGFSSLSYLRQLPIQKIKIDRSFVQDITTDSGNAAIVQGVITMAHQLQLKVIAEGIENQAQQENLRERGCDLLQGFLLARPMPLQALQQFMAAPAHVNT